MAEQTEPGKSPARFDNLAVYLLTVLTLLIVGGAVFAYLVFNRPKPGGESGGGSGRLVRVFKAHKTSHRLAITSYGTSRAAEVWTAITEVAGRAEDVHSRFEPGELLPAGTVLVQIDRTDYELARDRFKAEADAKQLQIKELNENEVHLKEILELQQRQLELSRHEYERQAKMYAKNRVVPLSELERAENAYVTQQTAVQGTRNTLSLVSVQRLRLEALLKVSTVQLEQAQRDLQRCQIRLPSDALCASKSVESHQFVTAGERLGTFLGLETAEVVAMVQTRKVAALLRGIDAESETLDLIEISRQGSLWKRFRIPVEVSWELGGEPVVWWGRLARIGSSLDPGTQTVPLIIEVRNPYKDIRPGVRPPLLPDAFCEITAYGATAGEVVVIPRDCLHEIPRQRSHGHAGNRAVVYVLRNWKMFVEEMRDGKLYIEEAGDGRGPEEKLAGAKRAGTETRNRKLRIHGDLLVKDVTVLALEKDRAVIGEGIEEGDLVILSDVPRAELSGVSPAGKEMRLRGDLVENPVEPRQKIDSPESLFEEVGEPNDRPTRDVPADSLPVSPAARNAVPPAARNAVPPDFRRPGK